MKTSLLALALLATLPFAASAAEGLSYNYVEGGYIKTDASGGDADGWAVKGSYAINPNFSVFGDFNRQKTDFGDVDVDQWRIGAGYNHEISTSTDLVTRVSYNRFDPESGSKFNGYNAEVGIRTAFNPYLEVYALGGYEDYTKKNGINPDGEFYGRLGAQAKLNQNWGLSADLKMNRDGDKEWFVGPRFSW
ncbi:Ax21 family protein [Xanthomonas translucens pv. translucens]|uniref:OmpO family porin n=1 Tax=Xanthomonas campestris pv. translucens TaxID=343 RepID=UPI0019D57F1B|nr:Ax21 family protein [Xanthomonas translucens]MCT8285196.1 Ax21 family protein [Xanthomonas translucens pv. translucens]MCT8302854.1 Ax21 family protein [Xanthomonas translucens pv. translucens]QSQ30650.1 Ax21 family protein [Xanthomonas translucens pv. translucens]QSQ45554.1 Ax21 family protein [Xanthomonas translucens pv. translucens]